MNFETLLTASAVCDRYKISTRTLDRWLKATADPFPAPIKLRKRRYWSLTELQAWERSAAAIAAKSV